MQIQSDVPLKDYSTMRLGGIAKHLVHVTTEEEVVKAVTWAEERGLPSVMVGGGSNILWRDEGYPGLVVVNEIKGYKEELITHEKPGEHHYHVTVGAGENWDQTVARTAKHGLTGIENLSLIPGTTGATPVQNVGAYYQDISDTLVHVRAYDKQAKKMVTLPKADCHLAYRTSRFKAADHGRFFIISITLHLERLNPTPPFYPSLQQYLDDHGKTEFTPQVIREAVIAVRSAKLPDPAKVANNGSFFANPKITQKQLDELQAEYHNVMHWPISEGLYKIPAAWLVQEAGFKDYHDTETGMGTWPTQALVLVNEHAKTTGDALKFSQTIVEAVEKKFGIALEREPQVL